MKKNNQIQFSDIPFPDTAPIERAVLADVCLRGELFGDILPLVTPDMFSNDARRDVWEMMVSEYNKGNSLSYTSIQPLLGRTFKEEIAAAITPETGLPSAIREHAANLRNAAARRRAYFAAAEFLQYAAIPSTSEQDILAATESLARSIEGPAPLQGEIKLADAIDEVKEDIKRIEKAVAEGKNIRVTTGFRYINEALNGGLKGGQLVVLAARPSVGKTAVMLQMAKSAAIAGNPVQVFSLEMPHSELAERMIYSTGEVRPFQVNHGDVHPDAMRRAEAQLSPLPLFINDFSRTQDEIISRMTQAVKKGRCNVAFIDYLGLIDDALNFGNAKLYQVIGRITGTLKAVAKRLNIPIVILCQLNRDAARDGRAPEIYDLRDSGSIEQDADIVLMLHQVTEPEFSLNLYLRKNRAGKKDITFRLLPNDTYSAFDELDPVLPPGASRPTPSKPLYEAVKEDEDNDDLPF